jgi:hypothetical protein
MRQATGTWPAVLGLTARQLSLQQPNPLQEAFSKISGPLLLDISLFSLLLRIYSLHAPLFLVFLFAFSNPSYVISLSIKLHQINMFALAGFTEHRASETSALFIARNDQRVDRNHSASSGKCIQEY